MAKTFTYYADSVGCLPGWDGLAAIYNGQANSKIKILQIKIHPNTTKFDSNAKMEISRITAVTGGTAITPSKYDTNSTSLPSQVTIVKNAYFATTTGAILRSYCNVPSVLDTSISVPFTSQRLAGRFSNRPGVNDIFSSANQKAETTITKVILREGEGIASTCPGANIPWQSNYQIIITNNSTNATYCIYTNDIPINTGMTQWAILNGSGSGVVLTVALVALDTIGISGQFASNANGLPELRIAKIDGVVLGGVTIQPLAFDTTNSLPSAVVLTEGPFLADLGQKKGITSDWNQGAAAGIPIANQFKLGTIRFLTNPGTITGPNTTTQLFQFMTQKLMTIVYDSKTDNGEIVLNCGECLAILEGRTAVSQSSMVSFGIEILFTYTQIGGMSKGRLIGGA